jgi:hypothetical protein
MLAEFQRKGLRCTVSFFARLTTDADTIAA